MGASPTQLNRSGRKQSGQLKPMGLVSIENFKLAPMAPLGPECVKTQKQTDLYPECPKKRTRESLGLRFYGGKKPNEVPVRCAALECSMNNFHTL